MFIFFLSMTMKSWVTTLTPLVIALATTVKSFVSNEPLSDQEIELIKYLFGTFIASGAIGAYLKIKKK